LVCFPKGIVFKHSNFCFFPSWGLGLGGGGVSTSLTKHGGCTPTIWFDFPKTAALCFSPHNHPLFPKLRGTGSRVFFETGVRFPPHHLFCFLLGSRFIIWRLFENHHFCVGFLVGWCPFFGPTPWTKAFKPFFPLFPPPRVQFWKSLVV